MTPAVLIMTRGTALTALVLADFLRNQSSFESLSELSLQWELLTRRLPVNQAKQPFRFLHLNFRPLSFLFLSPTLPNKYPFHTPHLFFLSPSHFHTSSSIEAFQYLTF